MEKESNLWFLRYKDVNLDKLIDLDPIQSESKVISDNDLLSDKENNKDIFNLESVRRKIEDNHFHDVLDPSNLKNMRQIHIKELEILKRRNQQDLKVKTQEIESLKAKLEKMTDNNIILTNQISELEMTLKKHQDEYEIQNRLLNDEIIKLNEKCINSDLFASKNIKFDDYVRTLECLNCANDQIDLLNKKIENLTLKLGDFHCANDRLYADNCKLSHVVTQNNENLEQLREKVKQFKADLESSEFKLSEKQKELDSLNLEKKSLFALVTELRANVDAEKQNHEIKMKHSEEKALMKNKIELAEIKLNHEKEISVLKEQINLLKKNEIPTETSDKWQKLINKNKYLESEIVNKNKFIDDISTSIDKLEMEYNAIERKSNEEHTQAIQKIKQNYEEKITELNNQLNLHLSTLRTVEKEKKNLKEKLSDSIERNKILEEEMIALKTQLKKKLCTLMTTVNEKT